MRRSAIKTVDRFGESREGLCKSGAEKGSDISGPVRAVEIQLADMGESHWDTPLCTSEPVVIGRE